MQLYGIKTKVIVLESPTIFYYLRSQYTYSMLKIKSNSVVHDQSTAVELKEHLAKLIEKQEEQMREKLQKQLEKEARIEAIEKDFIEWADQKEEKIKRKLQKSSKNKQDYLNKIVKKCKDHEKYLNQKFKNFQSKRKADVKVAWKKAEEFNQSIENYQTSKLLSQQRSTHHQKTEEHIAESRFCAQRPTTYQKGAHRQYFSVTYNNPSKYESKLYGNNSSKDYWAELNQSIKQLKFTQIVPTEAQEGQLINKIHMNYKLKETLDRFKQQMDQTQNQKIQQLGERLEKIEKSRMKKIALHKEKKNPRADVYDTEPAERRQNKPKKVDRTERIHSESVMRENRARDWSQPNKQKREEINQLYRQNGTEYLQQQKLKYLKTSLAKKVAVSAIEKKLYFQRLNH